ncbi:hypothetical protein DPMN_147625 [Dreissena polymorpha]|uniref:Uncharacterized protein n=1 Tax=Dreissena polymorpha TaxID=45954 RepID=A0A9D4F831_DREPO|nr:hypothetical protein DPMN_147625 [Dreissena polymorpha]
MLVCDHSDPSPFCSSYVCTCLCVTILTPGLILPALFVGERELDESKPIRAQLKTPDAKQPSIFLRYKESDPDKGHIKVYPGCLK